MSRQKHGTGSPRSFQFDFSAEVPTDTPVNDPKEVTREVPYDGEITTLVVGWSEGAANLAGVRLEYKDGEGLFPRVGDEDDGYLAGNGFTHAFDLTAPVSDDTELVAKFANADPDNSHYINLVATIKERDGE
jgi:hypothetical protein